MTDDLISRQDAIDAIGALSDTIFKNIEKGATYPPRAWFAGMANAESIIEALPSIDAVKHGAWIPVDWAEPRRYGCSECHRMVWELENYCPSCGARMDGDV